MSVLIDEVQQCIGILRAELLAERGTQSHWTGQLSSSAVSTATAVSALSIVASQYGRGSVDRSENDEQVVSGLQDLIERGIRWCLGSQNMDGGFGDTDRSYSNVATTILVRSALRLARPVVPESLWGPLDAADQRADAYVTQIGGLSALRRRYGKDRTFVIPILTNAALAGLIPWGEVQSLPFELAAVPQRFYRAVRMPVVSYAIPALVAIGQAKFFHRPPLNPLAYGIRRLSRNRTLEVLKRMQPTSGGYLEATPLTSFVLMSLASMGLHQHPVARNSIRFLTESILEDGAWPIDTNLATWITSLSIHALFESSSENTAWLDASLTRWLIGCQHLERHPFTGAEPGGWGWTDLSGAVPDGDDSPAAVIAIGKIARALPSTDPQKMQLRASAASGVQWILGLQNRDGGWPTFCRGWGKLPFDRSSTDLTAHSLRALDIAESSLGIDKSKYPGWKRAVQRGWNFLLRSQRADGAILPLWFGNQDQPDDENPFYGTARVLLACETLRGDSPMSPKIDAMLDRAAGFLVKHQNPDGGWGGGTSLTRWLERSERENQIPEEERERLSGPGLDAFDSRLGHNETEGVVQERNALKVTSSVEETAVVVEGLSKYWLWKREQIHRNPLPSESPGNSPSGGVKGCQPAIIRGSAHLCEAVRRERHRIPWPIGFYFAKLWYHEKLYATTFTCAALGNAAKVLLTDSAISDDLQ